MHTVEVSDFLKESDHNISREFCPQRNAIHSPFIIYIILNFLILISKLKFIKDYDETRLINGAVTYIENDPGP